MHLAIGVAHDPTCDWQDSNLRFMALTPWAHATELQSLPLASCALGLFSCVAGGIILCCPVAHRLNADSAHWCSVSAIWA